MKPQVVVKKKTPQNRDEALQRAAINRGAKLRPVKEIAPAGLRKGAKLDASQVLDMRRFSAAAVAPRKDSLAGHTTRGPVRRATLRKK